MKRLTFAFSTLAVLLTLALSGCPNAAGARHGPEAGLGTGSVTLRFGTPTGRTLLPDTFVFADHEGVFTPYYPDGTPPGTNLVREPVLIARGEDLAEQYNLWVGQWTLEIDVFSRVDDEYPVASGEVGPFTVAPDVTVPLVVPLAFATMEGPPGVLDWTIVNETGLTPDWVEITLEPMGVTTGDTINFNGSTIAETMSGSRTGIPAGFYLVTVRMEMGLVELNRGARRAIWTDVVHIYPGQTVPMTVTFDEAEDFFHAINRVWLFGDMTGWFDNLPGLESWELEARGDGTFVRDVLIAPNNHFRFSLTDIAGWTSGNLWWGSWFVPATNGDAVEVGTPGNAMTFMPFGHDNQAGTDRSWRMVEGGYYRLILDTIPTPRPVTETGPPVPRFTVERLVRGIEIDPPEASVARGAIRYFEAEVDVAEGISGAVNWSLVGPHHLDTTYLADGNSVRLTVAAHESYTTLILRATSAIDEWQYTDVEITVPAGIPPVENLWLVGGMTGWAETFPPGVPMVRYPAHGTTFTWRTGELHGGEVAANTQFRFNLLATPNEWNSTWFAPLREPDAGTTGLPTDIQLGEDIDMRLVSGTANGDNWNWRIAGAGWYTIAVDVATMTMLIERPVIADTVTVLGLDRLMVGESTQFTASVAGRNNPPQTVLWSLDEIAGTDFAAGTRINEQTGYLEIDANETAATLTVWATFNGDVRLETGQAATGFMVVQVLRAEPLPPPAFVILSEHGEASWTHDGINVREFMLRLYRNGYPLYVDVYDGEPEPYMVTVPVTDPHSHDFAPSMLDEEIGGVGTYHFTVAAITDNFEFEDSAATPSDTQDVTRRNQVLNHWWLGNGIGRWVNPDASGDYIVRLYRDGTFVGQRDSTRATLQNPGNATETVTTFDFAWVGLPADSSAQHTFTVTALSNGPLVLPSVSDPSPARLFNNVMGYNQPNAVGGTPRIWTIGEGGTGAYRRFIAGANNGRIAWSADGVTWTLAMQGDTRTGIFSTDVGVPIAVRGIARNDGDGFGRFVAVGHGGRAAYSDDGGATWTAVNPDFGTNNILSIAYGNGHFVAGAGYGWVRRSSDGENWQTITGWAGNNQPASAILNHGNVVSMVFSRTAGRFLAFAGNNGTYHGQHASSVDGSFWDWVSNGIPNNTGRNVQNTAVSTLGNFVVSFHGDTHLTRAVGFPVSGGSWLPAWVPHGLTGPNIRAIGYGHGRFIAVGAGGNATVSVNQGASWAILTNPLSGEITAAIGMEDHVILAGHDGFARVVAP